MAGTGTMSPVQAGGGSSAIGLGYAQPIPRTLLPITRYAEIMGIYLPHFWQLDGNKAPVTKGCGDNAIWDQDNRADLAWTILQAEEMIAQALGFWPAPKYLSNEQIAVGLPGVRSDWRNAELSTEWAQVQCFGTETLTLKLANATVTYQNLDSDPFGRHETATVEVSGVSACDDVCGVAVFFRVADGAEDAADPRWEIRPIKVDIDNGLMSIKAEASMFIKPTLLSLTKADCAGSSDTSAWKINYDTANLVSQVDVYCRTCNQATPVTLRWDGACNCPGPCQHETQSACAYATDTKRGFFIPRPATWNGTTNIEATPQQAFPPESVSVNYLAGLPLDSRDCRMTANMERAIVKLTNALLPEPPCGFCDPAQGRWDQDRKTIDPLTPEAASLPWDIYKQGALEAWRIVKMFSRGRGAKLGRGHR
jgi:hypothetical protein